jgi:polysaccharide deacetylase family protein (PEP-CTERM system associated)
MTVPAHALSIDVEDWFQVLNLGERIDRAEWERIELRCGDSTRRLLDLLDRHGARATFFFLGWIAERLPELVHDVAAAGHEIGSHGYDHRLLHDLGAEGFDEDLRRTEAILTPLAGRPTLFRACTWSITGRTPWAPLVLQRRGYRIDSSIYPIRHPEYGVPGAPSSPYRLTCGTGQLIEFPPLTWSVGGRRLPVGGGGYLRLLPTWLIARGLVQQERRGWPGCVYLHPWELDPEQPRVGIGGLRGFRHYVNLSRTAKKLARLLRRFRFVGLEAALAGSESRMPTMAAETLIGRSGAAVRPNG